MLPLQNQVIYLLYFLVFAHFSFAMDNNFRRVVSFPNTMQVKDSLNRNFQEIRKGRFLFLIERPENFPDNKIATSITMTGDAQTEGQTSRFYILDPELLGKRFSDDFSVTAPFLVEFSDGQKTTFPLTIKTSVARYRRSKHNYLIVRPDNPRDLSDFELHSQTPHIEGNIVFSKNSDYKLLLAQNNAPTKPAKSVWLIRESNSLDGGLVVSYYEPCSKTIINIIYVFEKSVRDKWISVLPDGFDRNGKKPIIVKLYSDSDNICGPIQFLYEILKNDGFDLAGQILPSLD